MISFFEKIFSTITGVVITIVTSLGLITAPTQPQAQVSIESTPIIQEQVINSKQKDSTEIKKTASGPIIVEVKKPLEKSEMSDVQSTPISIQTPVAPAYKNTEQVSSTPISNSQNQDQNIVVSIPVNLNISNVVTTPSMDKISFEWDTNLPSEGKVFVTGPGYQIPIIAYSNSGISTHHIAMITGLSPVTNYSYVIESITGDKSSKSNGSLVTTAPQISIQSQNVCNLSKTNFKNEYSLDTLLANDNIDGRIFMNAYVIDDQNRNYYTSNPSPTMIITTSDHSNDKTLNGSGNKGPCGYYYPYEFYSVTPGTYSVTFSIPLFNISKTEIITITN